MASRYRSKYGDNPVQFAFIEVSKDETYVLFRYTMSRQRPLVKYTLHYIDIELGAFAIDPLYTFYIERSNRKRYSPLIADKMSLLVYGIVTGNLFRAIKRIGGEYKNIKDLKVPENILDIVYENFVADYFSGKYDTNMTATADEIGALINGRKKK